MSQGATSFQCPLVKTYVIQNASKSLSANIEVKIENSIMFFQQLHDETIRYLFHDWP